MAPDPPRPSGAATLRSRFRRRRRRAVLGVLAIACGAAGTGALLVAPRGLASVRLLEVSLGWWAAGLACALELAVLVVVLRAERG
jgi:hypothetical protein